MRMQIHVFSDFNSTSIYINGKLEEHNILVRSAWLLNILYLKGIISPGNLIEQLVYKYGDFSKIPTIHEFITQDLILDPIFKIPLDIKSIKIDKIKKSPQTLKTLQKYLLIRYKITF